MGNSMANKSIDMNLLVQTLEKMEADVVNERRDRQLRLDTVVGRSWKMQLAAAAKERDSGKGGINKSRERIIHSVSPKAPPTPWNPVGSFDASKVPPTPPAKAPAKRSELDEKLAHCASITHLNSDSPLNEAEEKLRARGHHAFLRMQEAKKKLQQMHSEERKDAVKDEMQLIDEPAEPMMQAEELIESISLQPLDPLIETVTGAAEVPQLIERVDMSISEPSRDASDEQLIGVLERLERASAAKQRMRNAKKLLATLPKTPLKLPTDFVMSKGTTEIIHACAPTRVLSPTVHAQQIA
jgi:hypothetical protein